MNNNATVEKHQGNVSLDRITPHAFHTNLPPNHMDQDGIPFVTKFAHQKGRKIVELALSIQLTESLFLEADGEDVDGDAMEQDDNCEADDEQVSASSEPETIQGVAKKCSRLLSMVSSLESLKHSGITQEEVCRLVLHLLRLITCTIQTNEDGSIELEYENIGYVYHGPEDEQEYETVSGSEKLEADLKQPFALHSPAREVLLLVVINILSNKGPLRALTNASVYPSDSDKPRSLLILHWKALLRTLLRTAPYLDERKAATMKSDSNYRQSTVLKRTVQLIRDSRHFFDQGNRPHQPALNEDRTAREVWEMVESDVLYHSHTHACYRGTILLYLFQPSRCSSQYYADVMPLWWAAWTNIDRCPEYDFLWLALFCRARKHISPGQYDWGPIRKRLLTSAQYWLQLPIGGTAMDKSFPRAANPRSRSCPPRLKAFTGASSSYEEGIDFVAKVVKLLVTSLGTGAALAANCSNASAPDPNGSGEPAISEGTTDVLRFLSFVTPYFNPSNLGSWTFTLGAFLHYFAYELCCRVGTSAGMQALRSKMPAVVDAYLKIKPGASAMDVPAHEIVALLDALLPLCQQAIYSKNAHVGRAGEAAMLYLVQIDPVRASPAFIDFAARALDVAAVNQSHQAPAALSALTRLIQPSLRTNRSVLLMRLPQLLHLSLAGIDSNDQNKTIRTLILYRSLTSWIPVGGSPKDWAMVDTTSFSSDGRTDGTACLGENLFEIIRSKRECPEYQEAIKRLPDTSLLKLDLQDDSQGPEMARLVMEEAISAMSDWSLEFLDRVFGLLRASGEREKAGKTSSGVASRHSSADVHQARNFSRVLTECLMQLFASMSDDIHSLSVRSVARFLEEETLPSAAKDASLLCQGACAARERNNTKSPYSHGLDTLMPVMTSDLQHCSTKTAIYRLRCCAGAVRSAGKAVLAHRDAISGAIDFALASDDRHLFKTGCKLLRHTLSTLSESYPISSNSKPRVYHQGGAEDSYTFGRSAQLHGDGIEWHVPDGDCVSFAADLLQKHALTRLSSLCELGSDGKRSRMLTSTDIQELRRCLRVIRYSIRGGASLLLDQKVGDSDDFVPYEKASCRLIESASKEAQATILSIRSRLVGFLIVLSSVIASETLHPDASKQLPVDDPYHRVLPLITSDPKVCKETCDIALLLLTRRGASFRSQEARTIWKAQKQVATDFTLCAQVDCMIEILQGASIYGESETSLYKDGEDGGKTVPRRLLVSRIRLFHNSLQRNASFEVPRRLRRFEKESKGRRNVIFSVKSNLTEMVANLEEMLRAAPYKPLDGYEGIIDGLFAMCCHSNTQVRASAISVVDYAMTRFGWIVAPRVPRMLSGLSLEDAGLNGKFGVPSCTLLVEKLNQQGKRKRLSEAVKGMCSILSLTRAVRHVLGSWKMRYSFVKTICGTDPLIALIPAEEMQKVVHYLQAVFSPFRSSVYVLPKTSRGDREHHEQCLTLALEILAERKAEAVDVESSEKRAAHWRKQLLACWFLLVFVDEKLASQNSPLSQRIWSACFRLLENNMGQPLQRVALGLLGKLLALAECVPNESLRSHLATESFCKVICRTLVYDHKEDSSTGGGHEAQWSAGVENIVRDASRHTARRTLFPFQRTSQSLGSFKVSHCQLVELVLSALSESESAAARGHLLSFATELAAAPPSEDQRNQQITSAEVFGGVCGFRVRAASFTSAEWSDCFLPQLEDVMAKIPFSLCGAYFDAVRYSVQFLASESFHPLTVWLIEKVESTLWQPGSRETPETEESSPSQPGTNGSPQGAEGFTAQSKWLYLFSAVIIEMDETEVDGLILSPGWYQEKLTSSGKAPRLSNGNAVSTSGRTSSWALVTERLLPRLAEALGHPFDSCRDHISRCLFRICYSHRKMVRITASRAPSRCNSAVDMTIMATTSTADGDPGAMIVSELSSLAQGTKWVNNDRFNALSTARRFISYCVHLGEAKFEYSDYVIPLLSLAFEALNSNSEEEKTESTQGTKEGTAARRALEAEVVKGYRQMISEVSVTAVISYGRPLDITRVLEVVETACQHNRWQVRHAGANFLRCFEGAHKFLFRHEQQEKTTSLVTGLLADERREVSSAAMAALTGILAALPDDDVARMVEKYVKLAVKSKMKRSRKGATPAQPAADDEEAALREKDRSRNQQQSVFFLCACVMAQPYDTPSYVPQALAAISKHSFERNAPLGVRDTVKKCCAEYKRTHMSDNWELHRSKFSQEQMEAFEDVVSSPHYFA